jgi:hypothetical protein
MAAKPQSRPLYTVACACGARIEVDVRTFGRPRVCRSCGVSFTVAWGRDPKTRKTVPVAVRNRVAPKKLPFLAVCGCGYTRPVSKEESRTSVTCPGCGKAMAVEKAPDPKALEKARAPVKPPSKPLVPLHLRPPLRVVVKSGDKTFQCPCSERLLIRPDSEKKPIQCYKCGRFHTVELAGALPPPTRARGSVVPSTLPAAAPATRRPAPRGVTKGKEPVKSPEAPKPARPLGLGEVACACGAVIPPRTSRTGREFTCSQCGRQGRVEDSVDPKTKDVRLKAVFTTGLRPEASAKGGAANATPTPPPSKQPEASGPVTILDGWTCVCGQSIDSQEVFARHEIDCPGCGRTVKLERYRHSQSTMIRMRPVVTEKRVKPAAVETPPPRLQQERHTEETPPPSPTPPPVGAFAIEQLVPQPPEDDAPALLPKDAQIALCECGAELLVSREDIGHPIQCPACDVRMTVEEVPDLITGYSTLRVRSIGKMDDEAWSLDDFK